MQGDSLQLLRLQAPMWAMGPKPLSCNCRTRPGTPGVDAAQWRLKGFSETTPSLGHPKLWAREDRELGSQSLGRPAPSKPRWGVSSGFPRTQL